MVARIYSNRNPSSQLVHQHKTFAFKYTALHKGIYTLVSTCVMYTNLGRHSGFDIREIESRVKSIYTPDISATRGSLTYDCVFGDIIFGTTKTRAKKLTALT